jgi:ligand-binding SRPBCC domain-containing protein
MKRIVTLLVGLFAMNSATAQTIVLGRSATEITLEVEIDAPIEKVWANFKDVGGIYKNSPTVDSSYVISAIREGVGAKRYMIMSKAFKGAILEEENMIWNEAEHYQKFNAYRIYKVPGIQTMGGDFRLTAKGNKTILTSTLNYSMKNRMFGMMNGMMGRKKFEKVWTSILAGYKYHSETGTRVTEKTVLAMKDVKLVKV